MRITYIGHSGFLVETGTANFIFDYYEGEVPELNAALPLVVFASHRHRDHYNAEIFDWMERYPDITYVLDKNCGVKWKYRECEKRGIPLWEHVVSVRKNTECDIVLAGDRHLKLEMLRSTDTGVAFLIRYEGLVIYHAGDLNCWQWEENSRARNAEMERKYRREIDKLSGRSIDVAFVPLDPGQKTYMDRGMEIFLQKTETKKVFPMHMWGMYEEIQGFCDRHPEYKNQVVPIRKEGESFAFSLPV